MTEVDQPVPNPSEAPPLLPGDGIVVSKSLSIPRDQWNSGHVTVVYPDQGTCDAIVNMRGGIRARYALHYADDPRLKENPHWLPPHEADSGVWQLSGKERLVRENQIALARMEELIVKFSEELEEVKAGANGSEDQPVKRSPGRPRKEPANV